jgi:hypothetical protein
MFREDRLPPHKNDAIDQSGNDTSGSGADYPMPGNLSDGGRISSLRAVVIVSFRHGLSRKGRAIPKRDSLLRTLHIAVALRHPYRWSSTQRS